MIVFICMAQNIRLPTKSLMQVVVEVADILGQSYWLVVPYRKHKHVTFSCVFDVLFCIENLIARLFGLAKFSFIFVGNSFLEVQRWTVLFWVE